MSTKSQRHSAKTKANKARQAAKRNNKVKSPQTTVRKLLRTRNNIAKGIPRPSTIAKLRAERARPIAEFMTESVT